MLTRAADPMAQSFFQVILMVEYSNYDDKLVLQTVFYNDSLGQMFNQMTILTFCIGILHGTCLQGPSQIGSTKEAIASMFFLSIFFFFEILVCNIYILSINFRFPLSYNRCVL
jgi:hypothetical protein